MLWFQLPRLGLGGGGCRGVLLLVRVVLLASARRGGGTGVYSGATAAVGWSYRSSGGSPLPNRMVVPQLLRVRRKA